MLTCSVANLCHNLYMVLFTAVVWLYTCFDVLLVLMMKA